MKVIPRRTSPTGEAKYMKVFLAGATGAVGRRLVPLLVVAGHHVIATTTANQKLSALRAQGVEPLLLNGLDRAAVMAAVVSARPDAIIHQMTALASMRSLKNFDDEFALTNRLRTEGTSYLLEAAHTAGTTTFIAQGFTGWPNERAGSRVKTERDAPDPNPPKSMTRTLEALRALEHIVTGASASGMRGVVLRYGSLYGPGTAISQDGEIVEMVRRRRFPLIGDGAGVWSFTHVDDAARAAKVALERGAAGIYNIVDDHPVEVSVWLPDLARAIGARSPFHLPAWIGRFVVGEAGISMMTRVRGSSNAKAKNALRWRPEYKSWRDGFRYGLSPSMPTNVRYIA